MNNECVYTTIEYFPKSFNDESINVAFIFHDATEGKMYFYRAKNKKRITSFDDEMTMEEYEMLMDTFERFVTSPFKISLFNQHNNVVFDNNYLFSIKNSFLNEFRFSKISKIISENVKQDVENLLKLSLYYDFEKKDRLKPEMVEKVLRKNIIQQLQFNNKDYETDYAINDFGFGETIKVDFVFENTYIKILNLQSDKFTNKINTAKAWAFNKKYFDDRKKRIVFALPIEPSSDAENAYVKILRSTDAEVCYMDDISRIINY